MEIQQAQKELHARLIPLYGDREAAQITDWVMEHITGYKKLDRIVNKDLRLSPVQLDIFWQYIKGLSTHRPVQYVLHESWFCGFKFYVDEHVLIPRPETEELVEWVISTVNSCPGSASPRPNNVSPDPNKVSPGPGNTGASAGLSILDIGTGSGCIAISLKKKLPSIQVHACDVSPEALAVARRNATTLDADISFHQLDFLDEGQRETLPRLDLIVSNPPYVPLRDKAAMSPHVLDYEPHLALFVKDENPLIFYRAMAGFARQRLAPGGTLFAEIHEELAAPTEALFKSFDFQEVVIKKDMQGKERMIKATL